jgi:Kef-type K+ transport system membrane component KefB
MCGPYVLQVISQDFLKVFGSHISNSAFAFIGLEAGFMLYYPDLKPVYMDIVKQIFPVLGTCMIVVGMVIGIFGKQLGGFFNEFDDFAEDYTSCIFIVGLLYGALMASGSPAECVALIHELQPHGPIVMLSVGFTVLMDVMAIVSASILITLVKTACSDDFSEFSIPLLVFDIAFSIFSGWAIGKFFIQILKAENVPLVAQGAVVLFTSLMYFELSDWLQVVTECWGYTIRLENLLAILIASAVAGNDEDARENLSDILHACALPIFLSFFVYVGAYLNLAAVLDGISIAILLIVLRILCISSGSLLAGKYINKHPQDICSNLWLTYLPQAGVTLAIASDVEKVFRSSWGEEFNAVAVAVVLFFEMLGPIAMKYGLWRSGALDDEVDEKDDLKSRLLTKDMQTPDGKAITVHRRVRHSMDNSLTGGFNNRPTSTKSHDVLVEDGNGSFNDAPSSRRAISFNDTFSRNSKNVGAHATFLDYLVTSKRQVSTTSRTYSQYRESEMTRNSNSQPRREMTRQDMDISGGNDSAMDYQEYQDLKS